MKCPHKGDPMCECDTHDESPPICTQTAVDLGINPFTPIERYSAYVMLKFLPIRINWLDEYTAYYVPVKDGYPWVVYKEHE